MIGPLTTNPGAEPKQVHGCVVASGVVWRGPCVDVSTWNHYQPFSSQAEGGSFSSLRIHNTTTVHGELQNAGSPSSKLILQDVPVET